MNAFIKRQDATFYLTAIAFVLTLIGIILTGVSNSVQGYSMGSMGGITACVVIALILMAAGIVLADRFAREDFLASAAEIIALVLLMVAFGLLIGDRAVLASAQFSYDAVNQTGWTVLNESIAGLVMYLVSAILLVICGFLKPAKAGCSGLHADCK